MQRLMSLMLCALPCLAWAHEGEDHSQTMQNTNAPKLSIGASVHLTTNSKDAAGTDGLWRIPGALMGGHATPIEKGEYVNHASVWGKYVFNPKWDIQAAIATHDTQFSDLSAELEQLQINFRPTNQLQIQAGRMSTALAPSLSHHSEVSFTEASLMTETLFGRHMQDEGIRVQAQPIKGLTVGVEAWRGDFYPATKGEGAQDMFVQFNRQWDAWDVKLGAWSMQAHAVLRGDDRYTGDHSHSHGSGGGTIPVDIRFTGKTKLNGLWADLGRISNKGSKTGVQYEVVQSRSKGELFDPTRKADYSNDYTSYTITPYYNYKKLQFAYRFERMDVKNTVSGSGAAIIAQEANLLTSRSPKRETVQVTWRMKPHLSTVLAYTRDKTLSDKSNNRITVSLQWSDTLYQR